jgi:phosphoadenosine phosphosulfate reductase
MLTDIYYPELSLKWRNILYDFAVKTNKTDIEDYIDSGKWKARRGASGLQAKNVPIQDTPCNLSDRARNIIISKRLQPDVLEFLKPFGDLDITDKQDKTTISVHLDGEELFQVLVTYGTTVLKVLPLAIRDTNTLISRLKCQMRKYQFCIRCTACDSVCPYGAIDTMRGSYTIDETKCVHCHKCISKFSNGCITTQVLRGKHE